MNNKTCLICQSALLLDKCRTVPYPTENSTKDAPKRIIFCNRCGLGMADPLPSEDALNVLYTESNYWANVKPVVCPRKQTVFVALARSRWSLIQSHFNKPTEKARRLRILDVGAGFGYLGIVAANALGVMACEYGAIEPDPNVRSAIEEAWPEWGNKSRLDTFAELGNVKGKYDVVALSHVLEHIPDPRRMIKQVLPLMNEDAMLFIDVPNRDDLFKKDVFPHILFYTSESLKFLIGHTNLEIIDLDTWGNPIEKSPLNRNASVAVKIKGKFLGMILEFLPTAFSTFMIAKYFQINSRHEKGTWIRLLAQMKGNP
jgi:SAM-dependent methyltransferase